MGGKSGPVDPTTGAQFSEYAVRNNIGVLEYGRTCQSAASGAVAGILGLTSVYGFIFYFICAGVQGLIWWSKAGVISSDLHLYFLGKNALFSHSLLPGLFTYILFWTFLYGMVHVY